MLVRKQMASHLSAITDRNVNLFNMYDDYRPELMEALDNGFVGYDGPIIIDNSSNYHQIPDLMDIHARVSGMGLTQPWVILTSDFTVNSEIKNLMYYPFFVADALVHDIKEMDISSARNHTIGFVFNRPYLVRILSVIAMYQHPWFDTCLIKFPKQDLDIVGLSDHEHSIFNDILQTLPWNIGGDELITTGFLGVDSPGFFDCYINFMVESSYPTPMISEKSIKPFMAGQIPSVLGNKNVSALLKKWGFEMMENIIIHPQTNNIHDSLDIIIPQLTNIIENIEQVWHETLPERTHNYELVRSPNLLLSLQKELREWVNG